MRRFLIVLRHLNDCEHIDAGHTQNILAKGLRLKAAMQDAKNKLDDIGCGKDCLWRVYEVREDESALSDIRGKLRG